MFGWTAITQNIHRIASPNDSGADSAPIVLFGVMTPPEAAICTERRHSSMKKTESEQEIHARLRQLADEARRLREELTQSTRQRVVANAMDDLRPSTARGSKPRGKKR